MKYPVKEYTYLVYWSKLDDIFCSRCYEIPGCTGSGATEGEAVHDAQESVVVYQEYVEKLGIESPAPDAEGVRYSLIPKGKEKTNAE